MKPLNVSRVEVIDHTGRAYVLKRDGLKVTFSLQDDDRTLKVLIDAPANTAEGELK